MEDDHASPRGGREERPRTAPRLANSEFYRALASARRRRLLYTLLERGECSVGEAATVLTGWDLADSGGMGSPDDRRQVVLSLQHVHLPMLSEAGLVSFDREANAVALQPLEPPVADLIRRSVASAREHAQ